MAGPSRFALMINLVCWKASHLSISRATICTGGRHSHDTMCHVTGAMSHRPILPNAGLQASPSIQGPFTISTLACLPKRDAPIALFGSAAVRDRCINKTAAGVFSRKRHALLGLLELPYLLIIFAADYRPWAQGGSPCNNGQAECLQCP